MGRRRYDNEICKYNIGKKTKQPQPKEEGLYEFTNTTTYRGEIRFFSMRPFKSSLLVENAQEW